ncbi:hypothetical protein ABD76_02050 [Paenibacillus dendritiformis]|uniref:hypothetical protein n=1 Tax=Paenibacillus dendritiformis TaxID=130049 RepID=UPI0018CE6B69|nr:hypothetical protein [Paenibacillus dendritiformis]MBG9791369.1 hypothetical protein [Paenibacillus dendritiformis]
MKKRLTAGIASLAVLAMAGSAYAAEVPSGSIASKTVKVSAAEANGKAANHGLQSQLQVMPASSALRAEGVSGGKLKRQVMSKNMDRGGAEIAVSVKSLEGVAKAKGITVEERIAQLNREAKTSKSEQATMTILKK